MAIAYGLLAMVQERISGVLDGPRNGLLPEIAIDGDLLSQLRDGRVNIPRGLALGLDRLLDVTDLSDLAGVRDDDGLLTKLRGRVGGVAKDLLEGQGIAPLAASVKAIFKSSGDGNLALGGILRRQASIAVSFVTTLKNVADPNTLTAVRDGWARYFFDERGFVTLDDVPIVPPDQLGALK